MKSFVKSFAEAMSITRPAFIFDPDKEIISTWNSMPMSAMISATGDPKEADMVNQFLRHLIETDNLDSIFVLDSGLAELVGNVTNTLYILNTKINLLLPYGHSTDLRPRLDSRLYLFQIHDETNITLYENYQIR